VRNLRQAIVAAIATTFVVASGVLANAGDAVQGEHVFVACAPCHAKDKSIGIGPGLRGIIGRQAGSLPRFRYSGPMKAANIVWDEKSLDAFIAAPQKALPGTTMPYSGLPDQQKRANLIAYLETLK
jgi:cytochrome c